MRWARDFRGKGGLETRARASPIQCPGLAKRAVFSINYSYVLQENLEENEKIKESLNVQKIDEANTPYASPYQSGTEDELSDLMIERPVRSIGCVGLVRSMC